MMRNQFCALSLLPLVLATMNACRRDEIQERRQDGGASGKNVPAGGATGAWDHEGTNPGDGSPPPTGRTLVATLGWVDLMAQVLVVRVAQPLVAIVARARMARVARVARVANFGRTQCHSEQLRMTRPTIRRRFRLPSCLRPQRQEPWWFRMVFS